MSRGAASRVRRRRIGVLCPGLVREERVDREQLDDRGLDGSDGREGLRPGWGGGVPPYLRSRARSLDLAIKTNEPARKRQLPSGASVPARACARRNAVMIRAVDSRTARTSNR